MYKRDKDQKKFERFLGDIGYSSMFSSVGDIQDKEEDVKDVFGGENWIFVVTDDVETSDSVKEEITNNSYDFDVRSVYRGDNIRTKDEDSPGDYFQAYDAAVYAHGQSSISYDKRIFIVEVCRKVN